MKKTIQKLGKMLSCHLNGAELCLKKVFNLKRKNMMDIFIFLFLLIYLFIYLFLSLFLRWLSIVM